MNTIYYRPEWTCGRYNDEHKATIFYNLIEGLCFYYEDVSAEVIGYILSVKKNSPFDLNWLSQKSQVHIDSLKTFMGQLEQYGLIVQTIPTVEDIKSYRDNLIENRRKQVVKSIDSLHEMTIVGTADAERVYAEKVGCVTSVMFELTYRCSAKCVHCYNPGASRNDKESNLRGARKELSLDDYKLLIDELDEMGLTKVCLSGGDPFSNDLVWQIMDYLYEKEIAIDVFTNGISVVDKVGRLANYYPRTIGISLYSDVADVHDSITRTKGSHEKTISFIKACSQYALPMLLKCCIMKQNVSTYYTVKDVAYHFGALPQFDLNITDSVDGDISASTYLRLSHEEIEIVLRDKDLPYYIGSDGVKALKRIDNEKMCNAGFNSLCITPEGNIQPCCAFPLKLGNVSHNSIKETVEGSRILKWWRAQRIKDCYDCYKYEYCAYCQMCVGNNYIAHGNPLVSSENNCFLAKERYNLAVKMQNGYDPLKGKDLIQALSALKYQKQEFSRIQSTNHREDTRINGVS